jgi:selenocysteine lyase/cysteine desulfurase
MNLLQGRVAFMDNNWISIRNDFPCLQDTVYLNAAGVTPLPSAVHQAGVDILNRMHFDAKKFAEDMLFVNIMAHQSVADFYNVDINDIAFVHTTSLGMNMLALHLGHRIKNGKHIVTLADEFPASTLPWAVHGFNLTYVKADEGNCVSVESILAALTPQTDAVVASYVQSGTGCKLDLDTLANELRTRNVPLILNATQAAGCIQIDLAKTPVAAMLASGNKWMMAGYGATTLYVSKELRDESFPPLAGWLTAEPFSFTNNRLNSLSRNAPGLELGLNSLVPIACLEAAVKYIQAIGIKNIEQKIEELTGFLIKELVQRGAKIVTPTGSVEHAGIVTIVRDDAHQWIEKLKARNIVVVSRGENTVRISPHFYNNITDIEQLLEHW